MLENSSSSKVFSFELNFLKKFSYEPTLSIQNFPESEKEYDFDDPKEDKYREHMYKEFCDTLISNKYEVIIIDAVNHRISDFDIFYQKVKENGFWTVRQVFNDI